MGDSQKGAAFLDARAAQIITNDDVDFDRFLNHEERNRVVPAGFLAEAGKAAMLLGRGADIGLTLPWDKAGGKVLIRPGKLVLWVGWSHHGKSAMLKQIMLHAMAQSESVCVASMEEEILEVWSDMGRMACGDQNPGLLEINKWIAFATGKLWLYDQQGDVKTERVMAVMRYCALELGITHFVIDSMMMLSLAKDDYEAQAKFVGSLKTLAKDTGCTAHLVCHMKKRDGKSSEEQPGGLHDISGGHEIGSKADYVFNVWRNMSGNPNNPSCILGVMKQRGRTNWIGKLGLNYHVPSRQYIEDHRAMTFWETEREEAPI